MGEIEPNLFEKNVGHILCRIQWLAQFQLKGGGGGQAERMTLDFIFEISPS